MSGRSAAWLARLVRDQEVEGSNPFAPTTFLLKHPYLVQSLWLAALIFRRRKPQENPRPTIWKPRMGHPSCLFASAIITQWCPLADRDATKPKPNFQTSPFAE